MKFEVNVLEVKEGKYGISMRVWCSLGIPYEEFVFSFQEIKQLDNLLAILANAITIATKLQEEMDEKNRVAERKEIEAKIKVLQGELARLNGTNK